MNFTSVSGKNWIFKRFNADDVKNYSENYNLSEIVAKLISIRKKNINNIDLYLNPKIKNFISNPLNLKDMNNAVNRVYQCIEQNDLIGIFGDYDVDGATSTALLSKYFISLKQKIKTYIPDRKKEGYGPSVSGFNKLIKDGVKIIITVDCGTLSFEPIKVAQSKKVDVIVLDHHQSDISLPNACAIVNPNRYDEKSNLNYLCAAGVCFMFLIGLNKMLRDNNWFIKNKIKEPNILDFLDLVSLGTVCDVVPLVDLNRAIVSQGLKVLRNRSNLGLKTLFDLCKIETSPNTYHLGFVLGPRINAGGRVGKSSHGAELLSSDNPQVAYKIATDLDKSNKERQSIEILLKEKIDEEAKIYINDPVLVLSGKNWHEGIIGIVASRIKDKYNKPTVIISVNNSLGKGSARSILGFDIGAQILKATQLRVIMKGGGHKMAGGFTIQETNIPILRKFLINNFIKTKLDESKIVNLYLDSVIAPSALNEDFFYDVEKLAPFGSGNNEPKFAIEKIKVISSKIIKNNHIKSTLIGKDGTVFNSFYWNGMNTPIEEFLTGKNKKEFDIAGKIKLNEWRGEKKVEFIIEDVLIN